MTDTIQDSGASVPAEDVEPWDTRGMRLKRCLTWPARLMLTNPIVGKELCISSRRKRMYYGRALYLLFLVGYMLIAWYSVRSWSLSAAAVQTAGQQIQIESQMGSTLSITLMWFQVVIIALFAPLMAATSISDEIEDRSIDVLIASPLSMGQIVAGKLISRLIFITFMLLLTVPFFLAMRQYGGLSLSEIVMGELFTLAIAAIGLAAGMFFSAREGKGWQAVIASYFWLGLFWFLLPIILAGMISWISYLGAKISPWHFSAIPIESLVTITYMCINPFVAFSFEQSSYAATTWMWSLGIDTAVTISLAVNFSMAGLMLLLTTFAIRYRTRIRPKSSRARRSLFGRRKASLAGVSLIPAEYQDEQAEAVGDPSLAARVSAVADFRSAKTLPAGSVEIDVPRVWDHPILWRESGLQVRKKPIRFAIGVLAILALLAWYSYESDAFSKPEPHVLVFWIYAIWQLVLAIFLSPAMIAQEKQARSWDVLLCLPLSPSAIINQKYLVILRRLLFPTFAMICYTFVFVLFQPYLAVFALMIMMITWAFSLFMAATGLYLSVRFERTISAMVANFAVGAGLWAALPFVIAVFSGVFSAAGGSDLSGLWGAADLLNPFCWLGCATQPLAWGDGSSSMLHHFSWHHLVNYGLGEVSLWGFLMICVALLLVSSGIAKAILVVLAGRFNRLTHRPC